MIFRIVSSLCILKGSAKYWLQGNIESNFLQDIKWPLYSPDLNLCDTFLWTKSSLRALIHWRISEKPLWTKPGPSTKTSYKILLPIFNPISIRLLVQTIAIWKAFFKINFTHCLRFSQNFNTFDLVITMLCRFINTFSFSTVCIRRFFSQHSLVLILSVQATIFLLKVDAVWFKKSWDY